MTCSICERHPTLANRDSAFVSGGASSFRKKSISAHWSSRGHNRCRDADDRRQVCIQLINLFN